MSKPTFAAPPGPRAAVLRKRGHLLSRSWQARSRRLPRRLFNLYLGLVLFGVSVALMVRARLGLDSWDVFHQGLAKHTGLSFGWIVIAVSAVVLLLWVPLRQRPGIGTLSNAVVVGLVVNAALAVLPHQQSLVLRAGFLATGILMNGVATGLYIGAGLGPGPRDGLMTGLARRGLSIRVARTCIELSVLAAGWLLGGNIGVGTLLYAVSIGPLAHYFIPKLTVRHDDAGTNRTRAQRGPRLLNAGHVKARPLWSGVRMNVTEYIGANADGFFAALKEWISIPSISSDPDHARDVARSAQWLTGHLRDTGFPVAEIWETPGLPAVFAEWPAADPRAPAVLVYGHHDVQPVTPVEEWDTSPFVPVERGDQLFGRGASDDKGQILFHSLGLRANLSAAGATAPPVTIKLLVEGEEESGSIHLASLLRDNRERLRCKAIVVSDTPIWSRDVPSICIGTRGLVAAEISLYGPSVDLHSGAFGGGVPNPLHAMAELLGGLHDGRRRITLPGFYDDVVPLQDDERERLARLPFDEANWLAVAGNSKRADGEEGYSTLERIWVRPTAEINGMWGGYTGPGRKTIVPREARAKVSLRLVPDQDPGKVSKSLHDYVLQNTPPGIRPQVAFEGPGVRPCSVSITSPAVRAARRAMEKAFGTEVLFTRLGGSGPEADLAEILDAPLVFVAVGLDEDQAHAPNERVEMPLLLKGAETAAYLWDELAAALTGRSPHADGVTRI